jgi:hypothetical protein
MCLTNRAHPHRPGKTERVISGVDAAGAIRERW